MVESSSKQKAYPPLRVQRLHIQNVVLRQTAAHATRTGFADGRERGTPVDGGLEFVLLHGTYVEHGHTATADACTNHHRVDVTHLLGQLEREHHQVILANGNDFHRVRELIGRRVVSDIAGDELLRLGVPRGNHRLQERDEVNCMVSSTKEEVQSLLALLDVDGVAVRLMLEDQLLQVEKGLLV